MAEVLDPVPGVTRLVARDVGEQLLQQRLLGLVAHVAEEVEREALRHDLHAHRLELPVGRGDDGVEQLLQARRDREDLAEALDVGGKHLDVSGLVDRLGRGIQLAVHVRHGVHELAGDHQRALLAVQEVREHEGGRGARDVPARLEGETLPELRLRHRETAHAEGARERLAVDPGLPVELAQRDPLALERVRVERAELVDLGLVVPAVDGGERGAHFGGAQRGTLGQARAGLRGHAFSRRGRDARRVAAAGVQRPRSAHGGQGDVPAQPRPDGPGIAEYIGRKSPKSVTSPMLPSRPDRSSGS